MTDIENGNGTKNGAHSSSLKKEKSQDPIACEEGPGVVAHLLTIASLLMIAASLPLSLFLVVKVVQVRSCPNGTVETRLGIFRNTRGRSFFDSVVFWRVELVDRVCSL